jgi:hypothetical protein
VKQYRSVATPLTRSHSSELVPGSEQSSDTVYAFQRTIFDYTSTFGSVHMALTMREYYDLSDSIRRKSGRGRINQS